MGHLDRAIPEDLDGHRHLVVPQRDAILDRHHAQPALPPAVGAVESGDGIAALRHVPLGLGLGPQGRHGPVEASLAERLAAAHLGRHVADAVHVGLAHLLRRQVERLRRLLDRILVERHGRNHARRAARRVARAPTVVDSARGSKVGVAVAVVRPLQRHAKVARHAGAVRASRVELHIQVNRRDHSCGRLSGDAPRGLHARAAASGVHVVGALVVQPDGAPRLLGSHRSHHRCRQLCLQLAAVGAASAAHAYVHLVLADAECLADRRLRHRRVLRAARDGNLAVLGGARMRRVRLEVKVLLPTDAEGATQHRLTLSARRRAP
mmetsp:Transcript_22570/g.66554  ORF Transcript_22570/g.66554 Transcript_22570/m.66554 type:complete len:322 (+) Transcript_22570:1515-2480(+)